MFKLDYDAERTLERIRDYGNPENSFLVEEYPDLGLYQDYNAKWVVFDNRKGTCLIIRFENLTDAVEWIDSNLECDYLRVCDTCGCVLLNGFVIGDGEEHYCSEECLNAVMSTAKYNSLFFNDEAYWTEWDYE